jgi:Ni/Fe-hydrogenase b-type cytochrome subunit
VQPFGHRQRTFAKESAMEPHPPVPETAEAQPVSPPESASDRLVFRHRLSVRLWHWINAVVIFVMLGSGLMIFNAHPRLYWGHFGANFDPAWLELPRFPGWATIPSTYNLALARHWHLAFAWILAFGLLAYMIGSLINGHFRKDVALSRGEVAPGHLWEDIKKHARFDFHEEEARYNPLQKITYSIVLFVLIPGIILTGLTMSPGMNAAWPWLVDLFGGRQSARSLHFIFAAGIAAFIVIHVALVVLAGPVNELRSMITGWFRLPPPRTVSGDAS